jgi:Na+/H+ antiporter NhaD/arsenite permease-like protein
LQPDFWITTFLFALTYLALAVGKVPGLRMDRAGIALVGATLMLVSSQLSFEQAMSDKSINYEALVLLLGMMILVGTLQLSGFFDRLTNGLIPFLVSPQVFLAVTILLSGILSAFLVNDIICLAMTPLVIELAKRLRMDPLPHLMGVATASNIGSVGAITGNPQNMIIGVQSRIDYLRFSQKLFPIALLGLGVAFVLISWVYRARLRQSTPVVEPSEPSSAEADPLLQAKALAVTFLTVLLFFLLPSRYLAHTALAAAALMLMGRVLPEKIWGRVDWPLLVMFAGLFIVVTAFRRNVVSSWGVEGWSWLQERPVDLLSLVSLGLSNLVSNVPAVLLFGPIIEAMPAAQQETAWLALAMSSTLAGNLTVLGSVANLIVVENAKREGIEIAFLEYCKVGVPLTALTLLLGVVWLLFVPY